MHPLSLQENPAILQRPDSSPIEQWIVLASFLVPFFALTLFWTFCIRTDYFPYGDEFSLLVHSTRFFHPSITSWFTDGFSKYFIVYPEWTVPYTDYLRPVANTYYYLCSILFGSHWSYYLLPAYAIQSGLVAITVHFGRRWMELPISYALMAGLLVFLSPAFGWEEIYHPAFCFDLLGALLAFIGINQFLQKKFVSAWLLFAIAVFTKETSIFAPVVAFILVLLNPEEARRSRRFMLAAFFLLPILFLAVLRHLVFPGTGGIYGLVHSGPLHQVAKTVRGFLSWPMGMRTDYQSVFIRNLFFLLNALFWVAILGSAGYVYLRHRSSKTDTLHKTVGAEFGLNSRNRLDILYFCIGSLIMPVILELPSRNGAAFFPLFFLLVLSVSKFALSRHIRVTAITILVVATTVNLLQREVNPIGLKFHRFHWALSANYVQRLSHLASPVVFVVNDVSGDYATPESIARFGGYQGKIVTLSNFNFNAMSDHCQQPPSIDLQRSASGVFRVESDVSYSCGTYAFNGAGLLILASTDHRIPERHFGAATLRYDLSTLRAVPHSAAPSPYGKMAVEIVNAPSASVIFFPDITHLQYKEVALDTVRAYKSAN